MLQFYNSLSRKKEKFSPIETGSVKIYTCGPTVYDKAHIGNFRTFLFEDFLKRTLIALGYKVTHIMNITDVDDKTIQRANVSGKSLSEITDHFTELFWNDLTVLNIIPADHYPRATDHVRGMIKLIKSLITKDYAYVTDDGSVFFKISSFSSYGALTNIDISQMKQSDRVSSDEYGLDNLQDFALWKAYKKEDGDISWSSPWGMGRPGWHIECSSMSMEYLGNHFDIHCGGIDNKFPHHENEIAQSVCAVETPFVNTWLHSEFLLVDGGKMSKSLGNYYTVSDLLEKGFSPEEIRYTMLTTHYRSKVNFTLDKQHEAKMGIKRIQTLKSRLEEMGEKNDGSFPIAKEEFDKALKNDLDAPNAIAIMFEWVRKTNIRFDQKSISIQEAIEGLNFIYYFNSIFSIIKEQKDIPDEILKLVSLRENSRQNKDWKKSDELRNIIASKGWTVEDTPDGQKLSAK